MRPKLPPIDRRSFLVGSASCGAAHVVNQGARGTPRTATNVTLTVAPGRVSLVGAPHPDTAVWCFNAQVPGPEIRVRQGESHPRPRREPLAR
jgi:FtsP/CotA-like multicopper oxidase with cupredoxin domain